MHASLLHRRACYSSAKSIQSASHLLGLPSRATRISTPLSLLYFTPFPPLPYAARRTFSAPPSSPFQEPTKASSGWSIGFAILLVGAGVWLQEKYCSYGTNPSPQSIEPKIEAQDQDHDQFLGVIDTLKTMSAEAAPGTIGNLTPEQEAKLQEFWVLLFKVCGVQMDGIEETERPRSPVQEKKATPKRRFGLFGGSSSEKEESTSANGAASSLASLSITDGDDKFGTSKEFQQALAEIKPEDLRMAFWNMVKQDNPDSLLLRFLRARKWDVKKALMMLVSTIRWRLHDAKVDEDVMVNGELLALEQTNSSDPATKKKGEDFMKQFRMGKSFLHGVDKQGRPICYVRVRLHKAGDQDVEALDRFTVYTIESARMMLAPPVETACVIFDMTDFSLANMDYQPVKFMIKCFEANYPESLGVVLIHKAPWLFSSIWSVIKGWLDPVVAAKIQFTKNAADLEEFIPKSRIITELEGDEKWEYKYIEPQEGENAKLKDTAKRDELVAQRQELAKELQDSTVSWILASRKKDGDNAKDVAQKRKGLIERLRAHYWTMDPYVRAPSLYDRLNVLQGGGKIEFYPETTKENGEAAKTE
ncbi:CRAL-TRIO domain-containing protein [Aspergillus stella-maris]|uniref:CRAL-TRIO domain-containing protein n=1 Tax=Aspergillus stella-maris TaxID=1810926 RepID=UPI003CCCF9E0